MTLSTNMNHPPLGSNAVGGVNNYPRQGVQVGAIQTVTLAQGTDLGAGLTSEVFFEWRAPFAGFVREATVWVYDVTGTTTTDIYNSTTSTSMIAAQTITDKTSARVTTIASPTFAEGDVIQARITTTTAAKGAAWVLMLVPTADSSSNQYV